MELTIKLFGPEARALGRGQVVVQVKKLPIACGELRKTIAQAEPTLGKSLATARFAVNCDFVTDESMVNARDEIAIIGSVCGG